MEAMAQASLARARLSSPSASSSLCGAAIYQQGELHRLLGDFERGGGVLSRGQHRMAATRSPGLALLRLAEGESEAAAARPSTRAVAEADQTS